MRDAQAHRPLFMVFPSNLPALLDQPQMPTVTGPARPIFPDLRLFHLPQAAQALDLESETLLPAPSGGSVVLQILLGLYGELLPIAIYAAWLALGFWDLARNEQVPTTVRLGWMVGLVAVPILGPVAYYLFGRSQLARSFRLMFVLGAPVLYLAVTSLLISAATASGAMGFASAGALRKAGGRSANE